MELMSREAPMDEDALTEFSTFTPEEREIFFGCRAVLVEEGVEGARAERDAAAAIVQHRRLQNPTLSDREIQQAERFYAVLRDKMGDEDAEKEAVAKVLALRLHRGGRRSYG